MMMEVGELVGKAGEAASELGLDLQDIFEDPDKLQKYSQVTIAMVFAFIAWHRADDIKYKLYRFTGWLSGRNAGLSGEGLTWLEKALMALVPAFMVVEYTKYTGSIDKDAKKYAADLKAYQNNVDSWKKAVEGYETEIAKYAPGTGSPQLDAMKEKLAKLLANPPVAPVKPFFMDASVEERLIYAAVAFFVAMHPEVIGMALQGVGTILQGVGEIVPL